MTDNLLVTGPKDTPLRVLLYYEFAPIENPLDFRDEHLAFCNEHNLYGRIIVSGEGINGTVAGKKEDIDAYKNYVRKLDGFENTWFKEHGCSKIPFPKIQVKAKEETVALKGDSDISLQGEFIEPEDLNALYNKNPEDTVFIDMRNDIEWQVGRFKGAINPKTTHFRDLPKKLNELEEYKDKNVVLYCTGGIRCEKASSMLLKQGFKNVYQVKGGIYNYCTQFPDGLFEGNCFVFDDRMNIAFTNKGVEENIPEEKTISRCEFCNEKSARVVNDERVTHRKLMVCCEKCDLEHDISRIRRPDERTGSDARASAE